MNIFVLDTNPEIAAKMHCDKHVVKMILESVQMICTVSNELGVESPYKSTHKNHPCTKWVMESRSNFYWLVSLALNLNEEWKYRYNHKRMHLSIQKLFSMDFNLVANMLPDIGLTKFALAMPDKYKTNDVVESYRQYYINDKKDLLKFTKRGDWTNEQMG